MLNANRPICPLLWRGSQPPPHVVVTLAFCMKLDPADLP
ncbi:hypothetical protein HKBW3S03_02140, partial [Candidatus Hakubella thermalkaliphila]